MIATVCRDLLSSLYGFGMNPTDRQLRIVLALQTDGWQRGADLAERFGVSLRTIYRDMRDLEEAGVPVVSSPGRGYRLGEGYLLPSLRLTSEEAMVLWLGADEVKERLGAAYQDAARAARRKLGAVLPDRLRAEVATLQNSLRFVPVNAFDDPGEQALLHGLRQAVEERRMIRFYTPAAHRNGEEAAREHVVAPFGVVHLGGAWHLIGAERPDGGVQHFRLRRMERMTLLDETFERPPGYASGSARGGVRDRVVRVRFEAAAARWVRRAPSAYTVDTEETPDGLVVTLHVHRDAEVLPWLLSWGAHAHVLEPESLRRRLAEEAEKVSARYRPAPTLLG